MSYLLIPLSSHISIEKSSDGTVSRPQRQIGLEKTIKNEHRHQHYKHRNRTYREFRTAGQEKH